MTTHGEHNSHMKSFARVEKRFLWCNNRFMKGLWCQWIPEKVFPTFDDFLSYLPIQKICKKLKYHDGVLSYQQNSTANPAHFFGLPSKSHRGISMYFWNSASNMYVYCMHLLKRLSSFGRMYFFCYSMTLETYIAVM